MTTHHINPLAAPSRDRAIADGQIIKAGAFDPIVIPLRTDVADYEMFQRYSFDRLIEPSAIIQVETVATLATDL